MPTINFKRQTCINRLQKTFNALKEKNLDYDRDKLLMEIMVEFQVCQKTALEYLNAGIAFFQKIPEEDKILKEIDSVLT